VRRRAVTLRRTLKRALVVAVLVASLFGFTGARSAQASTFCIRAHAPWTHITLYPCLSTPSQL